MLKTLINRCLQIIPALFVVVTLTFVLTRMIPGDPARAVAGPQASVQDVEKLRESMGLNEPMLVQYKDYVLGVLQGDFGTSYSYNQPVLKLVAERIPNTLLLAIPSIAVALLIGMVIGVVSAVKQGSLFDYIFMILALIGVSMPIFWMGLMLVLTFSVRLGWLPALGMGTFENGLGDVIRHMVLPCFCLSTIPMATFARITRSSILESISSDSIRAIRARGIRDAIVIWKYALKSALPPIVTVLGLQLASCFAGAILTENVFSWPGMGSLMVGAIDNRDYMLIQGAVLVIALAFVLVNLAVDIVYMLINPRVSYEGGSYLPRSSQGESPMRYIPLTHIWASLRRGTCSARMKPEGICLQEYATGPGSLFWLQWEPRYWEVSSGWPWDLYRVTPAAWWMRSLCAAWTASWHFLLSCCPLSL